jgi:hypothetical protein
MEGQPWSIPLAGALKVDLVFSLMKPHIPSLDARLPVVTRFGLLAALCLFTAGCAGSLASRSQKLNLGMPRAQVVKILGGPFSTVAAREEADGRKIEVLRFEDSKSGEMLVYFRDGRMVQWGDVRALDNMPQ